MTHQPLSQDFKLFGLVDGVPGSIIKNILKLLCPAKRGRSAVHEAQGTDLHDVHRYHTGNLHLCQGLPRATKDTRTRATKRRKKNSPKKNKRGSKKNSPKKNKPGNEMSALCHNAA
jgi:hypothetical protein